MNYTYYKHFLLSKTYTNIIQYTVFVIKITVVRWKLLHFTDTFVHALYDVHLLYPFQLTSQLPLKYPSLLRQGEPDVRQ